METIYKNLVDRLEEVFEKNRDSEKGYRKAAENAHSQSLKSFFLTKAVERDAFNRSLKREMITSFDSIDDEGSFTGTVHRAWMDVKAFFSGDSDEAMLEEAIKGDKAALEEYEELIEDTAMPLNISQVINKQISKIRTDLKGIKKLEDLN